MQTLAGTDVTGYLKLQHGIVGLQTVEHDERYVFPTRRFIRERFAPWYRAELKGRGLLEAVPESNDCDKRSRRAVLDAVELHHKTRPGVGLAWGIFKYAMGGIGVGRRARNHVINIGVEVVSWAPVLVKPFFWDFLLWEEVTLTRREVESCMLLELG